MIVLRRPMSSGRQPPGRVRTSRQAPGEAARLVAAQDGGEGGGPGRGRAGRGLADAIGEAGEPRRPPHGRPAPRRMSPAHRCRLRPLLPAERGGSTQGPGRQLPELFESGPVRVRGFQRGGNRVPDLGAPGRAAPPSRPPGRPPAPRAAAGSRRAPADARRRSCPRVTTAHGAPERSVRAVPPRRRRAAHAAAVRPRRSGDAAGSTSNIASARVRRRMVRTASVGCRGAVSRQILVKVHSRLVLVPQVHCLVTEPEETLPPPSRTRPVVRLAME